jgi:hypothetical protein
MSLNANLVTLTVIQDKQLEILALSSLRFVHLGLPLSYHSVVNFKISKVNFDLIIWLFVFISCLFYYWLPLSIVNGWPLFFTFLK